MGGRLVGIGGPLAAGKDAVSDYLVETDAWTKLGMSDPLAQALYTLNPLIPIPRRFWLTKHVRYQDLFDEVGYVTAKRTPEVRELLQRLGTEVGRKMIGENTWIDIAKRTIQEHLDRGEDVIITGIRFPNEMGVIRELGGELWWVRRPGTGTGSTHDSENSVRAEQFDQVIDNDGTLLDLYSKVEGIKDRTTPGLDTSVLF